MRVLICLTRELHGRYNLNKESRRWPTRIMTRRRPFNRTVIRSNIAEAIAQLQKLEEKAADGTLTEVDLQVGLSHAYHHLNFAWNIRRVSTSEYARLTQEQFEQWGKYPAEIDDF